MDRIKFVFCIVLATWMTACLMAIVYSRDIAVFIVEKQNIERQSHPTNGFYKEPK